MAGTPRRRQYEDVPGSPVKSFFVNMLTRDISLEDSILDLLDNCVDGILRSRKPGSRLQPYRGFNAQIFFDSDGFEISDNCGGIPWKLHEYAFRLGKANERDLDDRPTVGFYGIGMKRAIFKIGRDSLIQTQNDDDAYEVEITPEWIDQDDLWAIPVEASEDRMEEDGTTVIISELRPEIKAIFGKGKEAFESLLRQRIATHYAFIISKGFEVYVNDELVEPRPTELRFESERQGAILRPYIYEAKIDDVEVFLAVGFTRPIPSVEEVIRESDEQQYSSRLAGWTVVCNDRAVLYANTDEMTGWGEAGVPRFHTQFTAIAGIVEFRSNDASKLPTNTTKRGIDANSTLYLQVKNRMREGMKMFTAFTNKWKGDGLAQVAKERIRKAPAKSFGDIKKAAKTIPMRKVKTTTGRARHYKPTLPAPPASKERRISFTKPIDRIQKVGRYLFDDENEKPSVIGEECFDRIFRKAKR